MGMLICTKKLIYIKFFKLCLLCCCIKFGGSLEKVFFVLKLTKDVFLIYKQYKSIKQGKIYVQTKENNNESEFRTVKINDKQRYDKLSNLFKH